MEYLVFLVSTEYGDFFASAVGAPPRQGMQYSLGGITFEPEVFLWDLELSQWFIVSNIKDEEMKMEKVVQGQGHGCWVCEPDQLEPRFQEVVKKHILKETQP